MQEGLAHVCLISGSRTIVRAKIDHNIPRKRKGDVKQHEKVFEFKLFIDKLFNIY